jgi:NAD(P)-dependent dehydrogenase (short-subunit alcohol dehydrogenase family)
MQKSHRTALVTGAGSGIGLATAKLLAKEGWQVAIVDVNGEAIERAAAELGPQSLPFTCDLSDAKAVEALMEDLSTRTGGRLDLLVNNAGLLWSGHFKDQPPQNIARITTVNTIALAICTRLAFPLLKASADAGGKPVVINLSSASSVFGIPSLAVYSASKFWVHGFTEALAVEWRGQGIAIRDVAPPFVHTPMMSGPAASNPFHVRMGANLSPEDVAHAILAAQPGGPVHRYMTGSLQLTRFLVALMPNAWTRRAMAMIGGY